MIVTDLKNSFNPLPKVKTKKKKKRKDFTDIPTKLKEIVWERDKHKCIYCGKYVPKNCANAHFVKRSQRWIRNTREYSYIMPRMPL